MRRFEHIRNMTRTSLAAVMLLLGLLAGSHALADFEDETKNKATVMAWLDSLPQVANEVYSVIYTGLDDTAFIPSQVLLGQAFENFAAGKRPRGWAYITKSEKSQNLNAKVIMAIAYEFGLLGKPKNLERANKLFRMAGGTRWYFPAPGYRAYNHWNVLALANFLKRNPNYQITNHEVFETKSHGHRIFVGFINSLLDEKKHHVGVTDAADAEELWQVASKSRDKKTAPYRLKLADYFALGVPSILEPDISRAFTLRKNVFDEAHGTFRNDTLLNRKLSLHYSRGEGVPRSIDKAFPHILIAANGGHKDAQIDLAIIYQNGMAGQERDGERAFQLAYPIAHQKHPVAANVLAYAYERGVGTTRDAELAYIWLRLAVEWGYQEQEIILKNMQEHFSPDQLVEYQRAYARFAEQFS